MARGGASCESAHGSDPVDLEDDAFALAGAFRFPSFAGAFPFPDYFTSAMTAFHRDRPQWRSL